MFSLALAFVFVGPPDTAREPPREPETEAASKPPILKDPFVTEVAFGASMSVVFVDVRKLQTGWAGLDGPPFVTSQWTPFAVNGELWVGPHIPAFDYVTTSLARSNAERNGVRTQLEMTFTELSYGYAVFNRRGFAVVPRLGFGIAETEVTVSSTSEDIAFDEVLANPARQVRLAKSGIITDLGLMLSYLISFGRRDQAGLGSGIRIGLKVGGLVQLFDLGRQSDAWASGPDSVSGAPDMRVDGGYVRLFVAPSLLHRSERIQRRAR